MIPIGVMSIPQFILMFIFPLLGAISIFIWLIYGFNCWINAMLHDLAINNRKVKSHGQKNGSLLLFLR